MAGRTGHDSVGKYVCPMCGARVVMTTFYSGFDRELLDPKTGEPTRTLIVERSTIHDEEFECNKKCGWKGRSSWKDDLDEEGESD